MRGKVRVASGPGSSARSRVHDRALEQALGQWRHGQDAHLTAATWMAVRWLLWRRWLEEKRSVRVQRDGATSDGDGDGDDGGDGDGDDDDDRDGEGERTDRQATCRHSCHRDSVRISPEC